MHIVGNELPKRDHSTKRRELIVSASKKYGSTEEARGIIPFQSIEMDPRDALIDDIAVLINDALTGPAIGVWQLAEIIVDTVQEAS